MELREQKIKQAELESEIRSDNYGNLPLMTLMFILIDDEIQIEERVENFVKSSYN
jgi:hypothetical protein